MIDFALKEFQPLRGKNVILATTASVSIYRVPDLVRDLRREGAEVWVAMSHDSARLVSPEMMRWASGREVVTELSGEVEHIALLRDKNAILLIAPASYNTIGKIASGVADSVTTSLASNALGNGNPMVVVPAMHLSMYSNPVLQRNVKMLREYGVRILDPIVEEGKAKFNPSVPVIDEIIRTSSTVRGKRALVITGRGQGLIDPVRIIANRSSGETGYWLSRALYRIGFDVTVIGNSPRDLPQQIRFIHAEYVDEFVERVSGVLKEEFDLVTVPAAIPDFVPAMSEEKLKSDGHVKLELAPAPKIVDLIRKMHSGILIPFRLTVTSEKNGLAHFEKSRPDGVVVNFYDQAGQPFGDSNGSFVFETKKRRKEISGINKEEACSRIAEEMAGMVQ